MLQTVVEGTDVYNSLGFATVADCCFLVSSVRIWLESHGKAQLSEWINLKLQHPPGGTSGPYLVPGESGEFDVCLGGVGNCNYELNGKSRLEIKRDLFHLNMTHE